MSEMVERVARAIWGKSDILPPWERVRDTGNLAVTEALMLARAAIEAMREPTEAMTVEGWRAAHRVITDDRCNHEMLRQSHRAMIDAALK